MKRNVFFRRTGALLLALVLALSLVPAAAAAEDDSSEEQDLTVTSLTFSEENELSLIEGGTTTLTATVEYTGDLTAADVIWSVGDERIVSQVSENTSLSDGTGTLTAGFKANMKGSTRITVTCGAAFISCDIVVSPRPAVDKLELSSTAETMTVGDTKELTATITYNTGFTSAEIHWELSDYRVGSLEYSQGEAGKTETATFTANNPGTTTLKVTCGGQTATCTITVNSPTVSAVSIPETLSLEVGDSKTLDATVTMSNGKPNTNSSSVKWSSDNESVATVDSRGRVKAVAVGTAVITAASAADAQIKDTCTVTVTEKTPPPVTPVTGVKIYEGNAPQGAERSLEPGQTLRLTARVEPENASNKEVTWTSSKPDVVKVENGTVTALKEDEAGAVITVTTADGGKTASLTVKVRKELRPVTGITIDPVAPVVATARGKTLSLERKDQSEKLTAVVYPADADNPAVVWTSSDESIVTVDESGRVTAVAPGVATVTVTSVANSSAVDTCEVTVSGITLSESSVALKVGQSKSVTATGYGRASGRLLWESKDPTVASGGGSKVVGLAMGTTTIRVYAANTNYEQTIQVTVVENTIPVSGLSVDAGEMLYFPSLLSEVNAAIRSDANDSSLSLVSVTGVTLATKEGIVHYGYVSPDTPNHGVGGSEVYYVSPNTIKGERGVSDLKYIPASGFSGTATINFMGSTNKSERLNITVYVTVKSTGDVALSTAVGRALTLTAKEFRDICQLKTGRNASYVTFTQPSASKGTLYYNYSASQWSQKVDGTTRYYLSSSPSLEKVTFVPAQNYTGTVSIPYRCTDTTGSSYSGTMTINVYAPGGGASGGVSYTTGINQRVTLDAGDFNSACQNFNDRTLSYIYFDSLPAASEGILYYNYTSSSSERVSADQSYYYSNTGSRNRISRVTFVPAGNFSGDVTIPYTGYDTAGQTYKDNLVIHVSDAAGTVYYTTGVDDPVTFRGEDFNEACQRSNGASLNYVTFTLPSSSVGTLYRNYRSSSNTGTRVASSTRYYRGTTPSLSEITFVPKSRYEGTVSIPFTGRDANGDEFEGTVSIVVGTGAGRVVTYSTASGGAVRLNASDFNAACRTATGEDLNYLSFELPASRYGTLYYQYNAARGSGTVVSSSSTYYRSGGSRLVDDVYFVSANVNGTASFQYTARSTGGTRFTGTVEIAIGNAAADSGFSNGTYYIGSADPIPLRTADFETACRTALGGTLSHIRFTSLPGESVGRLYMNYASPSRPGGQATTTSNYTVSSGLTIGQLSFVPKAGYQGQVSIPYTGYSTQGGSFSGNVTINVSISYCPTPFYDVDAAWDWARPSVEFLRYAGVSNGYSDGTFRPSRSISRGEFTLMVCRAFGFDTTARVSSFPDVPASSPYAGAIATAKSMGIVEGSGGRFLPDSAITRQSAMAIICRAMRAAGKKLPTTGGSVLNAYGDQAQIASHARDSVAALVNLGVVRGSTDMRINPTRSISRAEMAVILHRVLTL